MSSDLHSIGSYTSVLDIDLERCLQILIDYCYIFIGGPEEVVLAKCIAVKITGLTLVTLDIRLYAPNLISRHFIFAYSLYHKGNISI